MYTNAHALSEVKPLTVDNNVEVESIIILQALCSEVKPLTVDNNVEVESIIILQALCMYHCYTGFQTTIDKYCKLHPL